MISKEITSSQKFKEILPIIDRWLEYSTFKSQTPGVSVGILFGNDIIFRKEYGYANLENKIKLTKDHLFKCASHAKLVTASAIMKLCYEGKLNLQDKVNQYLPWFSSKNDLNLDNITIFHLLTHTSGIVTDGFIHQDSKDTNSIEIEKIKTAVIDGISCFKIDERIKYSNLGYTLLGLVIEAITDLGYSDYIQENIFKPLGIINSAMEVNKKNQNMLISGYSNTFPDRKRKPISSKDKFLDAPAGGLISNVEDLLKLYKAHINGNENLFPDSIKQQMQEVQVEFNGNKRGLGFEIGNFPKNQIAVHISGGTPGFRSHSCLISKENISIVVLANSTNAPVFTWSSTISEFMNLIISNPLKIDFDFKNQSFGNIYSKEVGIYESPYGIFLLEQIAQHLVIFAADSWNPAYSPIVLTANGNGYFTSPSPLPFAKEGEKIQFIANSNGIMDLFDSSGRIVKRFEYESNLRML